MDGSVRLRSLASFAAGVVVALLATVIVTQAWRADAAPGDDDSTLVPITPCRLVDTRQPGGVALTPGETRSIAAHGTNGPAPTPCTIPTDAVALSMNVTSDQPSAQSFWTFWPDGEPMPNASNLNPGPGEPPTPNAVTTPVSSAGKFNVYNDAGNVDMIIDVNGYYTEASLAELASRLAAAEAAIDGLDTREPFAVTARDEAEVLSAAEAVVEVEMNAPAAGQVTVNSSTSAVEQEPGDEVRCSINVKAGTPAVDTDYRQWWESSGVADGGYGQLAGTRVFAIGAASTVTYQLVCEPFGVGVNPQVFDSVLTAIFTPAP